VPFSDSVRQGRARDVSRPPLNKKTAVTKIFLETCWFRYERDPAKKAGQASTRPTQPTELYKKGEITMATQDEHQETVDNSAYNPFPEPQTIPSGWDTSGFFSAPQPTAVEQGDDSPESEIK